MIEVALTMGGVSQRVWMMLDTGADTSTIPPDLATALTGLEFDQLGEPGPDIRGMGTELTKSRMADAEIAYLGRSISLKIWVAPIPYPVLGRDDFMRRFQCRFFWDRNPPEFYVDAAPGGHSKVQQAPDPTIRPNRKRRH